MQQDTDYEDRLNLRAWIITLEEQVPAVERVIARLNRSINRGRRPQERDIAWANVFCELVRRQPADAIPYGLIRRAEVLETIVPIAMEYFRHPPKRR